MAVVVASDLRQVVLAKLCSEWEKLVLRLRSWTENNIEVSHGSESIHFILSTHLTPLDQR